MDRSECFLNPFGHRLLAAPLVTLILLCGIATATLRRPGPSDAEAFHERIRAAVASIPSVINQWVGNDIEMPIDVVALLRPNALVYRTYRNSSTQRVVILTLVQAKDARNLVGHYPPVCFTSHGWSVDSVDRQDWHCADRLIPVSEYHCSRATAGGFERMTVINFMVLPNGQLQADMEGVHRAAANYTRRFFGAAQFQLILDADLSLNERRSIFAQLITASRGAIEALGSADSP